MNDSLLSQIREDVEFLLSFLPAKNRKDVEPGLAPMFYVTGTYEGDLVLADRVAEICDRYGVEEEDYGEEDFVEAE